MEFEFDECKSVSNKAKHGVDFEEAQALWDDADAIMVDLPFPDEPRSMVLGVMNGKHWAAVVTKRGRAIRIISVRRARKQEVELYEQHKLTDR